MITNRKQIDINTYISKSKFVMGLGTLLKENKKKLFYFGRASTILRAPLVSICQGEAGDDEFGTQFFVKSYF